MRLALKRPVSVGSVEVTELVFREELVAGDLRGVKASSLSDPTIDDLLKISGRLCGQTDQVMSRLSVDDLGRVLEVVGGFLSGGPPTGPTP